jgi:hypothetical protein
MDDNSMPVIRIHETMATAFDVLYLMVLLPCVVLFQC